MYTPLAKRLRSLVLLCHSEEGGAGAVAKNKVSYLFEAHNEDERDWSAHTLKLVVARMASKIIVGDKRMFGEFFAEFGGQGGEGKKRQIRKRRSNRSL